MGVVVGRRGQKGGWAEPEPGVAGSAEPPPHPLASPLDRSGF